MRLLALMLVAVLAAAPAASLVTAAPSLATGPDAGAASPATAPEARIAAPVGSDLVAIQQTLALPAATWLNDNDGDKLFDSLEKRFALPGPQPVIVTFVAGTDVETAMERVQQVAPVAPRYVYHHYGGFAADLDVVQARAVASLPEVRQVEWSQPGELELDTATRTMNVRTVQEQLNITGDGQGAVQGDGTMIAILDTGFDGQHVDLKGKFVRFVDWSDDGKETEPYDSGNHGTHVASISAGLGAGNPEYRGVAPGADLVGFLISSSDTKGAAIKSIDYLLERRDELPVDVLTISFGFGITVDGTDALELAMDKAWEAGITTFKSTGNSGPNRGTVTIPGGARGIIGTASIFDAGEGGFRLSSFSSRGPTADGRIKPDIAAPGSSIMAASAGSTDGYVSFSGTSMASPFAAGVAALIKSVDPSLGPDDVRRILVQTATDWGPAGHDVDYGNGRLDALRAIQLATWEKHLRGDATAAELAAVNVTGEALPWHAAGVLTGQGSSASFHVEDASHWLAATFIANHSVQGPQGAVLNGYLAVIRDPDGVLVATVQPGGLGDVPSFGLGTAPGSARQQTVSVPVTKTGTYTIEVLSGGHDEVLWDVSAGLPAVELPPLLGDPVTLDEATTDDAEASAAGLLPLVGLLALIGLKRRR